MTATGDELGRTVDDTIRDLPLEDRVRITTMEDWGIEVLQEGLLRYILPIINDDPDGVPKVMAELCERLRETHKLRVTK